MRPYYQHGGIAFYHGDCREVPIERADAIVTDPRYGETPLVEYSFLVGGAAGSMFCGSGSALAAAKSLALLAVPWELTLQLQNGSAKSQPGSLSREVKEFSTVC